jgi:DNA-directed RNA polymerase subunit RPC12/RpoP
MMSPTYALLILALVLLGLGIVYSSLRQRRKQTPGVVVIQEGRLPGEVTGGVVCPSCGRRFRHVATFKDDLVKCPYCGTEID